MAEGSVAGVSAMDAEGKSVAFPRQSPDNNDDDDKAKKFPLQALPLELQMHIFSYLSLLDLRHVRRANRFYHSIVTAPFIRACIPPDVLAQQLLTVCGLCLKSSPLRDNLLWLTAEDFGVGLAARCEPCALKEARIRPSDLVYRFEIELSDRLWSRLCRMCGRPTWSISFFHDECGAKYTTARRYYYFLMCMRSLLTLVSVSIALVYYRSELIVLIPAVFMFPLMGMLFVFTLYRGYLTRTYHVTGILELLLLGVFIPPTYFFAKEVGRKQEGLPKGMTEACLVLYALNVLVRLLNSLGSLVLYFEYDRTMLSWPDPSRLRRCVNYVLSGLIFWTYPRFLEAQYIGRGHNMDEKSFGHKLHGFWLNFKERNASSRFSSDSEV